MLGRIVSVAYLEKLYIIEYTGHYARVEECQYPSIFKRFKKLAERLDVRRLPELYVKPNPVVNAYAEGTDLYYIVLNTGLLDIMTEDELEVILAHELGHVKCDHMKHMTTVNMLRELGPVVLQLLNVPGAGALYKAAELAMVNWYQKAEFSADRCALLGVQDLELVQGTLAKLAGFSQRHTEKMNVNGLVRQGRRHYEIGADSFIEKIIKVAVLLNLDHPVLVERIQEIADWSESAAYRRILQGEYVVDGLEIPIGDHCKICPNGHIQPIEALFCGIDGLNIREAPIVSNPKIGS